MLDAVFERLTAWLGFILPFTCEEAWLTRYPEATSNCLRVFPETPDAWRNDVEAARWAKVVEVLETVTGALEIERREKRIGSALEAAPKVWVHQSLLDAFDGLDPAEVFRTSQATLAPGDGPPDAFRLPERPGVAVDPLKAEGRKVRRAPGASCRRSEATRATPTSACATPTRWPTGTPPIREPPRE